MIAGFYLEGSGRTQFLGLIPEGKAGWYVSGEARERLHCGASLVASQFHSICLYSDSESKLERNHPSSESLRFRGSPVPALMID